jgi:hypothetical protein
MSQAPATTPARSFGGCERLQRWETQPATVTGPPMPLRHWFPLRSAAFPWNRERLQPWETHPDAALHSGPPRALPVPRWHPRFRPPSTSRPVCCLLLVPALLLMLWGNRSLWGDHPLWGNSPSPPLPVLPAPTTTGTCLLVRFLPLSSPLARLSCPSAVLTASPVVFWGSGTPAIPRNPPFTIPEP